MIKDPNFGFVEDYMKKSKAETAYLFEAHGDRTIVFIVDMQSADQIPALAELLFQEWGAKVEFHPVMTLEDLLTQTKVEDRSESFLEAPIRVEPDTLLRVERENLLIYLVKN